MFCVGIFGILCDFGGFVVLVGRKERRCLRGLCAKIDGLCEWIVL